MTIIAKRKMELTPFPLSLVCLRIMVRPVIMI